MTKIHHLSRDFKYEQGQTKIGKNLLLIEQTVVSTAWNLEGDHTSS